jgi:putative transposase
MVTFRRGEEYAEYVRLVAESFERFGLRVWEWCLMPNHVHLVAVPGDARSLAAAPGRTHWRRTRRVNFGDGCRGWLRQGSFASCPLDREHALAAERYVELNPVRAGLVRRPEEHAWSSARFRVLGERDGLTAGSPVTEEVAGWREYLGGGSDGEAEAEHVHGEAAGLGGVGRAARAGAGASARAGEAGAHAGQRQETGCVSPETRLMTCHLAGTSIVNSSISPCTRMGPAELPRRAVTTGVPRFMARRYSLAPAGVSSFTDTSSSSGSPGVKHTADVCAAGFTVTSFSRLKPTWHATALTSGTSTTTTVIAPTTLPPSLAVTTTSPGESYCTGYFVPGAPVRSKTPFPSASSLFPVDDVKRSESPLRIITTSLAVFPSSSVAVQVTVPAAGVGGVPDWLNVTSTGASSSSGRSMKNAREPRYVTSSEPPASVAASAVTV